MAGFLNRQFDVTDMNMKYKIVPKRQVRKNRRLSFNFFAQNTSLPGWQYFTLKYITVYEKILWICVNIVCVTAIGYLLLHLQHDWLRSPTFFTGETSKYPASKVEYPGISICDLNKISKRKAVQFATYLSNVTEGGLSFSQALSNIKLLGSLYDYTVPEDEAVLSKFQDILEKYDSTPEVRDLALRLRKLSTRCNDVLLACSWKGHETDCSNLFQTRLSDNGFCCMFNYLRPISRMYLYDDYKELDISKEDIVFSTPGKEYGLSVKLLIDHEDYFFNSLSSVGYLIQIFEPSDYPDKLSGSLKDILIGPGREALLDIEVSVLKTSPDVRSLSPHLRSCKFKDETTSLGDYSTSDCYVFCKVKSIMSLCGCLPFMLPVNKSSTKYLQDGVVEYCTLPDMTCLNRYKEKWTRYYPLDYENVYMPPLQAEKHESLDCSQCLPQCNSVTYNVHSSFFPIASQNKNFSKVHIFFTKPYAHFYKHNLVLTWYEALSSFGGTISLFAGISIINALELIVYVTKLILSKIIVS